MPQTSLVLAYVACLCALHTMRVHIPASPTSSMMTDLAVPSFFKNLYRSAPEDFMQIYNGTPQRVTMFLSQQERTTIPLQPDGNYFFQALSTVLYGHQEKHQELRNHLVHFISSHKEIFRTFMFSVLPLEGHLKK